ncbi:MAG: Kiwa anti-phage protein KwaB-like domain-containing protein, partial [Nitrosotalea sp.]
RIDCIYFSDDQDLLILNKDEMESIFKFDDYYKQKTKDVYDSKLQNILISAPDNLFDLIKESPQITKKVTRMARDNKFDISTEDLQKHMESLEENKDRFTEQFKNYRSLEQEAGLYVTSDKDEFKVFLNACDKSVEIPLEQKEEDEPDIYLNPSPIKMTD